VVGDSNLVVRQTDGAFALKEISLAPTQSLVQKLCDEIDVELTHVNRSTNRHADSLATDASKRKFEDDENEALIKISKQRTPAHGTLMSCYMKMSLKKKIGDML
jgi:ribonuclease HI